MLKFTRRSAIASVAALGLVATGVRKAWIWVGGRGPPTGGRLVRSKGWGFSVLASIAVVRADFFSNHSGAQGAI